MDRAHGLGLLVLLDLVHSHAVKNIREGLNAFDSKYVRFSFTAPPKPAVLSAQQELDGEDNVNYKYLLMPVRLPNQ